LVHKFKCEWTTPLAKELSRVAVKRRSETKMTKEKKKKKKDKGKEKEILKPKYPIVDAKYSPTADSFYTFNEISELVSHGDPSVSGTKLDVGIFLSEVSAWLFTHGIRNGPSAEFRLLEILISEPKRVWVNLMKESTFFTFCEPLAHLKELLEYLPRVRFVYMSLKETHNPYVNSTISTILEQLPNLEGAYIRVADGCIVVPTDKQLVFGQKKGTVDRKFEYVYIDTAFSKLEATMGLLPSTTQRIMVPLDDMSQQMKKFYETAWQTAIVEGHLFMVYDNTRDYLPVGDDDDTSDPSLPGITYLDVSIPSGKSIKNFITDTTERMTQLECLKLNLGDYLSNVFLARGSLAKKAASRTVTDLSIEFGFQDVALDMCQFISYAFPAVITLALTFHVEGEAARDVVQYHKLFAQKTGNNTTTTTFASLRSLAIRSIGDGVLGTTDDAEAFARDAREHTGVKLRHLEIEDETLFTLLETPMCETLQYLCINRLKSSHLHLPSTVARGLKFLEIRESNSRVRIEELGGMEGLTTLIGRFSGRHLSVMPTVVNLQLLADARSVEETDRPLSMRRAFSAFPKMERLVMWLDQEDDELIRLPEQLAILVGGLIPPVGEIRLSEEMPPSLRSITFLVTTAPGVSEKQKPKTRYASARSISGHSVDIVIIYVTMYSDGKQTPNPFNRYLLPFRNTSEDGAYTDSVELPRDVPEDLSRTVQRYN
jgi:hypothetical protein